jgi:hypothetical protein
MVTCSGKIYSTGLVDLSAFDADEDIASTALTADNRHTHSYMGSRAFR